MIKCLKFERVVNLAPLMLRIYELPDFHRFRSTVKSRFIKEFSNEIVIWRYLFKKVLLIIRYVVLGKVADDLSQIRTKRNTELGEFGYKMEFGGALDPTKVDEMIYSKILCMFSRKK